MNIECPLPEALTSIPVENCPFRFDQIVRFGFQRRAAAAFASPAVMITLAPWTPKLVATDDEKVVMSPFFAGMVIPQSEALTTGGNDNSTFNGIPDYNGEGMVTVTGQFKNLSPLAKTALDKLAQESIASPVGVTNLELFMFNKNKVGFSIGTKGVQVYNFRVSSVGSEGFNAPNIHNFSFNLPGDWDTGLTSFTPIFDPFTELNNA